ncbi:hypothetical protein PhaeoP66_03242 [Phaeobacter inhibens]|uniref:Uncharacterized protein n=1 Tax=Phaeobacter inhibens TaxID=221822 RepID=A0ABN5GRA6_9RHOB|nr:hypothetical protein [Phaeobacter inhibens]AUQ95984.1 hypothetical protein PhaeoP66_03242 [Phaeobacter inhibens]
MAVNDAMGLAELIQKADEAGLLDTLSLYSRNGAWQANAKRVGGGWQCVPCDDPAKGLEQAVRGLFGHSNQPDAQPGSTGGAFG